MDNWLKDVPGTDIESGYTFKDKIFLMENLNYQTNKADIKSACDIEPMPALFLNALEWKADQK